MRACAWWAALLLAVARARELDPAACSARFDVQRDKIIRTEESREMGARYLAELDVGSRAECLRLCCETDACDVFVFEEKSPGSCYLFACGPPEDFRCKFTAHGNFSSGVLALARQLAEQQDRQRHEQQLALLRNPSTSKPAGSADPTSRPPRLPRPMTTPAGLLQQPVSSTQPQHPPPPRRCSRYQFECRRGGECIAVYNACDGVPQCADHSDEAPELGCPAPASSPAPPAHAAPPAPASPPAPRPPHAQVMPAAVDKLGGASGAGGAAGAGVAASAGGAGGAGQPDGADAGELWPWRLTQAQRRYPVMPGPAGAVGAGGAAGAGGSAPHIFSHQGGLLQAGALAPGWPRRAWPLGSPPDAPSRSVVDSMEGEVEGGAAGAGAGRSRVRPGAWSQEQSGAWPEERPGAWPEERPRAWPEERRAWPVPARLDPEPAVYAPARTMPELPLYAAAAPQRAAGAAPHDAPKKGLELPPPPPRTAPQAAPPPPPQHDSSAAKKESLKNTVALQRRAGAGAGAGAEARDGPSERPPAAVLLLVLGTLMTAALGALLACRARAARSRRRAHPRLALDADYLVNGMYL